MHHPTDRIAHTTAFVTPVVKHWLERDIVTINITTSIIVTGIIIIVIIVNVVDIVINFL